MSTRPRLLPVPLLPLLTLGCGQLLMIGSFAAWASGPGFEMIGVEGDGAVTQVAGVYASILGLLLTAQVVPRRPVLSMLLVAFVASIGVTLLNLVDTAGRVSGAPPGSDVVMSWGSVVTFVAAVAGSALTVVQLRQLRHRRQT